MAHIIPTAVKEQLLSSPSTWTSKPGDWSSISLPVYQSCFDQYGFGDWSVMQEQATSTYTTSKSGNVASLSLLDVPDGYVATQRADIFLGNTGCTSNTYNLDISGVVETFNGASSSWPRSFELLRILIDGAEMDFAGAVMTKTNAPGAPTFTFPANSTVLESQFNDQDSNEWGADVYVPTKVITVPAGPCVKQITFWADTVDMAHNTTQLGDVKYDITITKV